MELPANMMTPTVSLTSAFHQSNIPLKAHLAQIFARRVKEAFAGLKNVTIFVRDEGTSSPLDLLIVKIITLLSAWAADKNMVCLLKFQSIYHNLTIFPDRIPSFR